MDRRLFLTGLAGVVGTAALVAVLPPQAEVLAATTPAVDPAMGSDALPGLEDGTPASEEGEQLAYYDYTYRRRRRRHHDHDHHHHHGVRRRVRRRRRVCRPYRHHGHWFRKCHWQTGWVWIWVY